MKTSPAFPTDLLLLVTSAVAELTPVNTQKWWLYKEIFNKYVCEKQI